jgi:hypothetical protein
MVSGPSSAPQISSSRADVDMRRHACWWRVREPATLTREPRCGMTGPATTLDRHPDDILAAYMAAGT